MANSVTIGEFALSVETVLKDYKYRIDDDTKRIVKQVAKESADVVKQHTPSNWSNDYKKQIKASAPVVERGNYTSYVHMSGDNYRIAHLLENGHALVRGGRTLGNVKAYPHFKFGEEYAERELPKRLEEAIR